MLYFKQYIESQEQSNKYIKIADGWEIVNGDGAPGTEIDNDSSWEYDAAKKEDYLKHMSNKEYLDAIKNNSLPALEGLHWGIDYTLYEIAGNKLPQIDAILNRKQAELIRETSFYFHDYTNKIYIYIKINQEEEDKIKSIIGQGISKIISSRKEYGNEREILYSYAGFQDAVNRIKKILALEEEDLKFRNDPRMKVPKFPGEDDKDWLVRATNLLYGPTGVHAPQKPINPDDVNPRDDYYKR